MPDRPRCASWFFASILLYPYLWRPDLSRPAEAAAACSNAVAHACPVGPCGLSVPLPRHHNNCINRPPE